MSAQRWVFLLLNHNRSPTLCGIPWPTFQLRADVIAPAAANLFFMPRLLPKSASLPSALGCALVLALAGCSLVPTAPPGAVQWAADSATVRLAAGPQYARGAVWCFFLGTHYRAIWTTPVTVPVLRLATAVPGGLKPLQAGGSYQSHTLRLRDSIGHEFVLRSVDKDMSAALPSGFWHWLLGGLLKDQTSITQPYGAYVAAPLAEAAGVLHANPRLVYLADDPALGQFRASYGKAMYLLEERASGDQEDRTGFGRAPEIANTRHLLLHLRQRPAGQVVARAYLRARLLDMWLGDWSRREDQWRWASFPRAGYTWYLPIPRDRDQAFFQFDDGVLPRLVSWFVPKFQSFHATLRLSNVDGLTSTARALDRTLLGTLGPDDFRQEAYSLRHRLSDAVIAQALTAGPAETRAVIAARFGPLLRARRAQLAAVAQRYYEVLAKDAWLVGTDAAERFVVSAAGPGQLRVRVLAMRPARADSLLAERLFVRQDTRSLSLYGLAGDDVFELRPPLNQGIAVNIFDGNGHDQVPRPANQTANFPDFTWYSNPDGDARRNQAGINVEPDPHPELSNDSAGWLKQYKLQD